MYHPAREGAGFGTQSQTTLTVKEGSSSKRMRKVRRIRIFWKSWNNRWSRDFLTRRV
jgi:hypothetical protein